MKKLGIIGVGNMGETLLRGAVQSGCVLPDQITIFDTNIEKTGRLANELDVSAAGAMKELLLDSEIVILAVKPNICSGLFDQYRKQFSGKAIISIVAGWSRERLASELPTDVRILRIMPNTPALVGEGMVVFEKGDTLLPEERQLAVQLFSAIGTVECVDARLIDAVTGVSGSGPAYVYMFIEAMADGGVREGLPRDLAYKLAAQTVLGSAKMVLETGRHPGELKDMVCSPGGTTIDAVASLEENGLRHAVMEAVHSCTQKSIQMSK